MKNDKLDPVESLPLKTKTDIENDEKNASEIDATLALSGEEIEKP